MLYWGGKKNENAPANSVWIKIIYAVRRILPACLRNDNSVRLCGVLSVRGQIPFDCRPAGTVYFFLFLYQAALWTRCGFLLYFWKDYRRQMIGLFAYYLASPLNIIFLFFPLESFPTAVMILTLVKIGLCGITGQIYFSRIRPGRISILFAVCYSLMTYNIIYQQNIMCLTASSSCLWF